MTHAQLRWLKRALLAVLAVAAVLSFRPLSRLPLLGPHLHRAASPAPAATAATDSSSAAPAKAVGVTRSGMGPTIAVIGGGLAGLSAAHEAAAALAAELPAARVVVFEKNPSLGGNSAKASSGINAINAAAGDSATAYEADTVKSGGGLSNEALVQQLVGNSVEGLAFLEGLGLNLSSIVRLGGHAFPRTHSNPTGPNVGFALIKAVSAKVTAAPNVEVLTNTKVLRVVQESDGRLSIMYAAAAPAAPAAAAGGPALEEPPLPAIMLVDALVLASGGFAASKEMLQKHSPAAAELATTNGPWATGDGIQLGEELGAALLHMDQVQVHPTGFVDPADPSSGTKWLAPEKLRGCGALLLNTAGDRFVDELQTRDKVAAALLQQPGKVAWLVLGGDGAAMFGEGTLGFYASKGLVKKFESLADAAAHMGLDAAGLRATLEAYNAGAAAAAAAGSDGGSDSSSGDAFGKRYFPTTLDPAAPLWLGQVTPVVHYCMGGLAINDQAQVLSKADGSPIRGLFAAGEVSGGLHGANRLGGNSLAECVVFGRIAGQRAAAHVAPSVVVLPTRVGVAGGANVAAAAAL